MSTITRNNYSRHVIVLRLIQIYLFGDVSGLVSRAGVVLRL